MECFKASWQLVKEQYWLYVGMCAVGILIGSAVPLGILMGPMMCGLFLSFFKRRRGEPIEFGTLFKGFDYFGPSVVATLLHIIPILAIVIPAYIFFYLSLVFSLIGMGGGEPEPAAMFAIFFMVVAFWVAVIFLIAIISIGFTFVYPLIVDRQLSGFDAVKLSFRAAMANFWRLLGMALLSFVLGLAGVLVCYVGVFLVFPLTYGAIAIAYEKVFGLRGPDEVTPNLPPPPPTF
jgi:hypothetical protein